VCIWDVGTGRELLTLKGHFPQVNSIAFSPDGKRLATHSVYHTVKLWDVESGQDMLTLKSGFGRGIAFSPDGRQLAGAGDDAMKIWDATPLQEKP
jgi:WD40 repeat protein